MHQNRLSPLGELTALSQTPQMHLTVLLLREEVGRKGRGDATHLATLLLCSHIKYDCGVCRSAVSFCKML